MSAPLRELHGRGGPEGVVPEHLIAGLARESQSLIASTNSTERDDHKWWEVA